MKPPKNANTVTIPVTFPAGVKYGQLLAACKRAGIPISCELYPKGGDHEPDIYKPWPNDAMPVRLLLGEAKRQIGLGVKWFRQGKDTAAQLAFSMAHSSAMSASWLRCELAGEHKKSKP